MSGNRNKDADRRNTAALALSMSAGSNHAVANDGENWLGHTGQSALVDEALLFGASSQALKAMRSTYAAHIRHLQEEHGLYIESRNDVKRFVLSPIKSS